MLNLEYVVKRRINYIEMFIKFITKKLCLIMLFSSKIKVGVKYPSHILLNCEILK